MSKSLAKLADNPGRLAGTWYFLLVVVSVSALALIVSGNATHSSLIVLEITSNIGSLSPAG